MAKLIPVQYGRLAYPTHIKPEIREVAGHFDAKGPAPRGKYSLHTEYSFGGRQFTSPYLAGCDYLPTAASAGVPLLWRDERWSKDFARFIGNWSKQAKPAVIEIHPPFKDYCRNHEAFVQTYGVFEELVSQTTPSSLIVLENRAGTTYKESAFLVSRAEDIVSFCEALDKGQHSLRMVIDFPQIFGAHRMGRGRFSEKAMVEIMERVKPCMKFAAGIHIWGSKTKSHMGDLNDYFVEDHLKQVFLHKLSELLDDGTSRYLVPEVNSSSQDLASILKDLEDAGIKWE